ncbi:MAG: SPOR domain-containing protein [Bacteroidetes bacterium]|nr:SPOR domain-containing protein [Bacteroidota bacterium]
MPRLNLKDDSLEGDAGPAGQDRDMATPPTLREVGGGGGSSPLILILIIIVVLAGGVFALNYFGIIHLWGKKTPAAVSDQLPEADLPPPDWAAATGEGEVGTGEDDLMAPSTQLPDAELPDVVPPGSQLTSSPTTSEPSLTLPTSGSGDYTVQVSAWMSRTKADNEAAKLSTAGFEAFVEDAMVYGSTWYRVRVGRYASMMDAQQAASQLQSMMEGVVWVGRVGR